MWLITCELFHSGKCSRLQPASLPISSTLPWPFIGLWILSARFSQPTTPPRGNSCVLTVRLLGTTWRLVISQSDELPGKEKPSHLDVQDFDRFSQSLQETLVSAGCTHCGRRLDLHGCDHRSRFSKSGSIEIFQLIWIYFDYFGFDICKSLYDLYISSCFRQGRPLTERRWRTPRDLVWHVLGRWFASLAFCVPCGSCGSWNWGPELRAWLGFPSWIKLVNESTSQPVINPVINPAITPCFVVNEIKCQQIVSYARHDHGTILPGRERERERVRRQRAKPDRERERENCFLLNLDLDSIMISISTNLPLK